MKEKAPAPRSAARLETEGGRGLDTPFGEDLSMKGTSGAAERVLLRGRAREAALKTGCAEARPRQASLWMPSNSRGIFGGGVSSLRRKQPCDRRCPSRIGLGKSFHRERSRVGGALRRFNHESLWPVTSRLAALRKGPGHPPSIAATEATPARWAGLDRSSSCARNSFRLQTSPSGARSSRPRVNSP